MRVNLNYSRTLSVAAIAALALAQLTVAQAAQRNGSQCVRLLCWAGSTGRYGNREQVI